MQVATFATPSTSNRCDGVAVPMPTLLLEESTFKVVVSIVTSPLTVKADRVPNEVTLACAAVDNVPPKLVADTVVATVNVLPSQVRLSEPAKEPLLLN